MSKESTIIHDPDMVWAEFELLKGINSMHGGERHDFELMLRHVMQAAYAVNPVTRKAAYRQIAFNIADLMVAVKVTD